MKTGIFYGSTTGKTANIASKIAEKLGVDAADVMDIAKTSPEKLSEYDFIIAGSSTWGNGDMQRSWFDMLDALPVLDLRGKTVALFGCGDSKHSETFCNAVGTLFKTFEKTGAKMVGAYNTFPYEFDKSTAVPVEGAFAVGLLIDDKNYADQTDRRIAEWTDSLKQL